MRLNGPVPADDPRVEETAKALRDGQEPTWKPWDELSETTRAHLRNTARYMLARMDAQLEQIGVSS